MRAPSLLFPHFVFDPVFSEDSGLRTHSHVEETEKGYFVQIDAPGVKKEDVKISIEGQNLLVEAERKGRIAGVLRKRFSLPDDVSVDEIAAQMNDGVLEIALPKKEALKPKTIPISEGKEGFFQKLL